MAIWILVVRVGAAGAEAAGAGPVMASPPPDLLRPDGDGFRDVAFAERTGPLQLEPLVHTLLVKVVVARQPAKFLLVLVVAETDGAGR